MKRSLIRNSNHVISFNGNILPEAEVATEVSHSAIYYGTGSFETVRSEKSNLIWFNKHYERLVSGLRYLGVSESQIPIKADLINTIKELLIRFELDQKTAMVRIQVSLMESKGYDIDNDAKVMQLITCKPVFKHRKPLNLMVSETRLIPSVCKPASYKLSNMLHYRQAYREARQQNCDDAILLSINDFVGETSVANLFWKINDTVYTPSTHCDILPGTVRDAVISVVENSIQFRLVEGEFEYKDLLKADVAWCTNSNMELCPIQSIGEKKFRGSNASFEWIFEKYQALKASMHNHE